ncbi:MAG: hypothetical protein LPK48_05610, partial [Bacteroidota bacterium]|nr:hypothetical protein [Bacteroidota bacterium]
MRVKGVWNILISGVLLWMGGNLQAQPLQFTQNKGQWHSNIRFESDILSGKLYLENKGFTYYFFNGEDYAPFQHATQAPRPSSDYATIRFHAIKTQFLGANQVQPVGDFAYTFYRNYFIGNDRSKWASHVPVHQSVAYPKIYDGIDLYVYGEQNQLKYDWVIKAHADPKNIRVQYQGAEDLFLSDGKLFVRTSFNHF